MDGSQPCALCKPCVRPRIDQQCVWPCHLNVCAVTLHRVLCGSQALRNAMLEHLRLHFNNEEASDEQVTGAFLLPSCSATAKDQ